MGRGGSKFRGGVDILLATYLGGGGSEINKSWSRVEAEGGGGGHISLGIWGSEFRFHKKCLSFWGGGGFVP